jgi:hypothetical protein
MKQSDPLWRIMMLCRLLRYARNDMLLRFARNDMLPHFARNGF